MEARRKKALKMVQTASRGLPEEEEKSGKALLNEEGVHLIRALRSPIITGPGTSETMVSCYPSWQRLVRVGQCS